MYAAKVARSGVVIYSSQLDSHDRGRLELLHDFHVALNEETLTLAYQPKVSARTRKLHSVEALLRWNHPALGAVSPSVFVPLAEQAGLSGPLMRWVLDTALRQCRAWEDQGRPMAICVNVSMYDLRDESFPDLVAERLAVYGASANLLGIEVTESAAMADPNRTRNSLDRLRALGVRVSVDDFGTGYSSLAYLVGLPVDELKIDQSFVAGMATSEQHAAIVRSTIRLAHDLNLMVVAEGVEDEATWARLREYGCDLIQGYVVSRPVSSALLETWLDHRNDLTTVARAA
jgi:diguanylate cyclase